MEDQDFEPRPYQVELLQSAIEHNTIIFLPTGSGKTFIALQLLKYLSSELEKSLEEGGKRSVFLVNTVPLVEQQANFIKAQTYIKNVGEYTGAKNVDNWTKEQWQSEINQNKVLVMTTQILVDILNHGYLSLEVINLIILDECHHATKEHPMRQLMVIYKDYELRNDIRILGLTASLLNANCKPNNVYFEVNSLEISLQSKIATVDNMESVLGFSTNPRESIEWYKSSGTIDVLKKLIEELEHTKLKLTSFPNAEMHPEVDRMIYIKRTCKTARDIVSNMIQDFIQDIETLGAFGAVQSAKIRHLELERFKRIAVNKLDAVLYGQLITAILYVKKQINRYIQTKHGLKRIYDMSTPKLLKLIEVIKQYSPKNGTKKFPLKGIIFVQRRFTANVLYQIFKVLSEEDEEFNFVKPEFIVGMSNKGMTQSVENSLERKWYKKALLKFRFGEVNLLIASNVVEEGIDVPKCSLVVRFDPIPTFCSYTQSKGRARSKDSDFITLVCEDEMSKFQSKYKQFKELEQNLSSLLVGQTDGRPMPNLEDFEDAIVPPYKTSLAQATLVSAISLINRYCSSLPQDIFTKLTINYFRESKQSLDESQTLHRVLIQFPIICPIREGIKGDWQLSIRDAKRHAALCAVQRLHQCGELDEHLMPVTHRKADDLTFFKGYFDHWIRDELKKDAQGNALHKPGTKGRIRQHYRILPDALKNCMPCPNQDTYLHLLEVSPDYNKPSELDNRAFKFYNMLNSRETYAILSSKPFPDLCEFPLFLGVGKVKINIKMNFGYVNLTHEQIAKIRVFHVMLFRDILQVLKGFLVCDTHNENISFLVCPVNESLNIDWKTIESFPEVKIPEHPLQQQRMEMTIDPEDYREAVVIPWYRTISARTVYIVTRVCEEMTPHSKFPTESYDSYNSYFRDKYNLEAIHSKQPLLEVKPLSFSKLNCLKPRASRSKKYFNTDLESSTFDEHLIPEFCLLIKYPAVLYLKAALLPSILHRISNLMRARELIEIISIDLNLREPCIKNSALSCKIDLMSDPNESDSMSKFKTSPDASVDIDLDSSVSSNDSDAMGALSLIDKKLLDNYEFELQKLNKEFDWDISKEPLDFRRSADQMLAIDLDYFCKFTNKEHIEKQPVSYKPQFDVPNQLAICYSSENSMPLQILNNHSEIVELKDMLAVLTAKTANDICDLERLETLGDSFLKFAVTLYLADQFRDLNEGHLTYMKGQVVGNKNLLYCGLTKNLAGYMNIYDFAPCADWVPPGFTLPKEIRQVLIEKDISAEVLYGQNVPQEEVISGYLSSQTLKSIVKELNEIGEDRNESTTLENLVGMLKVNDKTVADCIEALLGQYLLSHGIRTCLRLLAYLKILPYSDDLVNLMDSEPMPSKLNEGIESSQIDFFLPGYKVLEKSLGYVFKNRSYLLQALTHASFSMNRYTDCYQRMEFVGDSILDFLITAHIYEHCGLLSPGDLTDLRSALVNNNTFASLTVRYGFHVHLLALNPNLSDSISKFVSFQEQRNHKVDVELLQLLEEGECSIAESVDVPKVLGDIFESLACAVFLDCGKDLNKVWNVFYKLMSNEIKLFSEKVPKQVVRLLYESNCRPKFLEAQIVEKSNMVAIPLTFSHEGRIRMVYGLGVNKQQAKKAASKIALQMLGR